MSQAISTGMEKQDPQKISKHGNGAFYRPTNSPATLNNYFPINDNNLVQYFYPRKGKIKITPSRDKQRPLTEKQKATSHPKLQQSLFQIQAAKTIGEAYNLNTNTEQALIPSQAIKILHRYAKTESEANKQLSTSENRISYASLNCDAISLNQSCVIKKYLKKQTPVVDIKKKVKMIETCQEYSMSRQSQSQEAMRWQLLKRMKFLQRKIMKKIPILSEMGVKLYKYR